MPPCQKLQALRRTITQRQHHLSSCHDASRQGLNPGKQIHKFLSREYSGDATRVPAMLRPTHIPTSVTIVMFAIVLAAPLFVILFVPTLE